MENSNGTLMSVADFKGLLTKEPEKLVGPPLARRPVQAGFSASGARLVGEGREAGGD